MPSQSPSPLATPTGGLGLPDDEAIDLVAHHLIRACIHRAFDWEDPWEDYPDIGEYDFQAVRIRALEIAGEPDITDAIRLLAARADTDV